jgi:structural maintenance of chromosome 2
LKVFTRVKDEQTSAQAALTRNEELLQTLLTGVATTSNNTGGGYMGQLADAQARLAQAETEEAQIKGKLSMHQTELKTQQARFKEVEKEVGQGVRLLEQRRGEIANIRKKLDASGWSTDKQRQKENELQGIRDEVRQLTQVRELSAFSFPLRLTPC